MPNYVLSIVVEGKDSASGPLGRVSSALGGLGKIAGGIIGIGALYAIGNGIVSLGKSALESTASYERLGATLSSLVARELRNADATLTMENAMLLAKGQSKELLGWIQKLAIQSPFDTESVGATFRQAMTYGFATKQAQELTQILVDMSAGMGLTADQMGSVSYALGQINQADKLLMQDLRQLTSAGVPVNDILKTMGYTMADVGKEAIDTQEFLEAFNEMMGNDFKDAAKKQSVSWAGLLNSMSDIKKIGLREFFSSTFSEIQPLLETFVTKMTDPAIQEQIRKWGEPLGEFTKKLINLVSKMNSGDFDIGVMFLGWSERFKNWSKGMDWAGISDELIAGLEEIDWEGAGVKIEDFASDVFSGIGVAVTKIKWGEITNALMIGLSEMTASALTGQQVTLESSLAGYQQFGDGVRAAIFGWQAKTEEALFAWSVRLRTNLSTFQANTETAIFNVFAGMMTSANNAIVMSEGLFTASFNRIITPLLEFIKSKGKDFLARGQAWMAQLIAGMVGMTETIQKAIQTLIANIMSVINPIVIPVSYGAPSGSPGGTTGGTTGGHAIRKPKPGKTGSRGLDNFVVPPGYPNDSFPIMVQSGEQVNVSQPGTYRGSNSGKAGGDTIINVNILVDKISSALDIRQLAYQVANEIQARRA